MKIYNAHGHRVLRLCIWRWHKCIDKHTLRSNGISFFVYHFTAPRNKLYIILRAARPSIGIRISAILLILFLQIRTRSGDKKTTSALRKKCLEPVFLWEKRSSILSFSFSSSWFYLTNVYVNNYRVAQKECNTYDQWFQENEGQNTQAGSIIAYKIIFPTRWHLDEGVWILWPCFWGNVIFKICYFCLKSHNWRTENFNCLAPPGKVFALAL